MTRVSATRLLWRLLISTSVLTVLTIAGCSSPSRGIDDASAPVPSAVTTLPDLTGKPLVEVARISESLSSTVTLVFPAVRENWSKPAVTAPTSGTRYPARTGSYDVARHTYLLEGFSAIGDERTGYRVVSMSASAGAPVSQIGTITLTLGPHPNPTTISWGYGHALAVQKQGAVSCLEECHTESYCSECHLKID
jgi:hypothetical protein